MTEVKKSLIKNAGKGLFTVKPFVKGEIIGEYTGILKTEDEITDEDLIYAYDYDNAHSLIGTGPCAMINDIVDVRVLTPEETKNSDYNKVWPKIDGLEYNCEFQQKGKTVNIVATKDIPSGAELYISYGHSYWNGTYNKNGYLTKWW